jgi:hypothetical protein
MLDPKDSRATRNKDNVLAPYETKSSDSIHPTGPEAEEPVQVPHSAGEQEIRDRAYEFYLQRGAQAGSDLEDWLQAERELSSTTSN